VRLRYRRVAATVLAMASRIKRSRERLTRATLKRQRSITRAELNKENCVLVRPSEWEEMISLMHAAYQEIRELTVSAASKLDSVWEKLMILSNKKGRKGRR
jgi:hypothetical protein